jgi:hypothetical protein
MKNSQITGSGLPSDLVFKIKQPINPVPLKTFWGAETETTVKTKTKA